MVALAAFDDAMSTALAFCEEAANARDELTKSAAWSSAELWFAEAAYVLELEDSESGR